MTNLLDSWLDRSLLGYTRLGARLRGLRPLDEPRLDGRVAVVTGATSGIGVAAAARLADLGAEVILVGRERAKAEATRDRLVAGGAERKLALEVADLSSVAETHALACRLAERGPVHLLVNNSGVMLDAHERTDEGVERALATNLLSSFVLTESLADVLAASGDARVVNVSSGGMYAERLDLEILFDRLPIGDGAGYDGVRRYAQTKRAQVELTSLWAERWRQRGIAVHSMHPGWVDTPGVERSLPRFYRMMRPWLRSPAEGADTIVWLCSADELPVGRFWHDRRTRPEHRLSRTVVGDDVRAELWRSLDELRLRHSLPEPELERGAA